MLTPSLLLKTTPFDFKMLICWDRFSLLRPIFSINSLAVISLSLNVFRISSRFSFERTLQTSACSSKIFSIHYLPLILKVNWGETFKTILLEAGLYRLARQRGQRDKREGEIQGGSIRGVILLQQANE